MTLSIPDEGYSRNVSCTLNYLAFQSFDIEHTWWRLFLKRVLHTKLFGFPIFWLWAYLFKVISGFLAFQSFDIERTWWRLFQKHVLHARLYIYIFTFNFYSTGRFRLNRLILFMTGLQHWRNYKKMEHVTINLLLHVWKNLNSTFVDWCGRIDRAMKWMKLPSEFITSFYDKMDSGDILTF